MDSNLVEVQEDLDGILVEALKGSDQVQKSLVAQYCCQSYKAHLGLCN